MSSSSCISAFLPYLTVLHPKVEAEGSVSLHQMLLAAALVSFHLMAPKRVVVVSKLCTCSFSYMCSYLVAVASCQVVAVFCRQVVAASCHQVAAAF
jgi:hypothetical protein